uniref:Uncharacterized protein n=1 Tax=Glossina palpalis gambiensis TaxID=67801 RepID=A0A1B0BYK4_9MUSC
MHQAGGKSGRPKNSYTAEALETIKQDLTRFQVQKDNGVQVLNELEDGGKERKYYTMLCNE